MPKPSCAALLRPAFFLAAVLAAAGCKSVLGIRPPVPTILQGNTYNQQDLDKLSEGMTDSQVLYVLGTPLLRPIYDPNQWYYYSSAVREGQTALHRLLVLRFEGERLADWEERFKNVEFFEDARLREIERAFPEDSEDPVRALDPFEEEEDGQASPQRPGG